MNLGSNNKLAATMRAFNNVAQDFRRNGTPSYSSTPVGGIRRFATPPILRGVPGNVVQSGPGSDYTQQFIKVQSVSLTTTFTDILYNLSGTVLWYQNSTNLTDSLQIRVGDINADRMIWGPGNGIEGIPYSRIYLTNLTAVAGATASLVYFLDSPDKPVRFF